MSSITADLTVVGASIPAAVAAIKARRAGKKVLMLNRYGFPGGPVTENLCCHLIKPDFEGTTPVTQELYDLFVHTEQALLYEDQGSVLLDPESVKFRLQEKLIAEGVELLWHVSPWKKNTVGDRLTELILLAKEGTIAVGSEKWIGHRLFPAVPQRGGSTNDLYFCFFYTGDQPEEIGPDGANQLQLANHRYWVGIHRTIGDPGEAVNMAQDLTDEVNRKLKGRLQLVPAEPFVSPAAGAFDSGTVKNIISEIPYDGSIPVYMGDLLQAVAIERSEL